MLQGGNFKEGAELLGKGKSGVPLPDDNVQAFIIILNIIHGHNRLVPRQISFDMMTEIMLLADKYQIVEALEAFSFGWIENLKRLLPKTAMTESEVLDVHKWIAISWVFKITDVFRSMTKLLQFHCYDDAVDSFEYLPVPESAISKSLQDF
jgi:hypothetical protein